MGMNILLRILASGLVLVWFSASSAQETGIDLSDWDWSGTSDEVAQPKPVAPAEPKRSTRVRVGETAAPDLAAEPRTAIELFAGLPPFRVVPSVKDGEMHPCGNCHRWAESDPTPRTLKEPHDNFVLQHGLHGKGQLWCFTCHHLEGDGGLRTLEGEKVGFDDAYVICSQCHTSQARDWAYGAHGKRVGNWRGERKVLNCTACHYQHRPAWKPRDAKSGPEIRQGLERPDHWAARAQRHATQHTPKGLWERQQAIEHD